MLFYFVEMLSELSESNFADVKTNIIITNLLL